MSDAPLVSLAPKSKFNVVDLVEAAGVDVSEWRSTWAANPKFCYEWAFVQKGKVVVFSLWHDELVEENGRIFQNINMRQQAENATKIQNNPIWRLRGERFDEIAHYAYGYSIPARVIICSGLKRDTTAPKAKASKVKFRELDTERWHISAYNPLTGNCTIVRGPSTDRFVDQFFLNTAEPQQPVKKSATGFAFARDPNIRKIALQRASGRCELCGETGFKMSNGQIYLETHHVVALADGGADHQSNVVALCPNDHRRAHHAQDKEDIANILRGLLLGLVAHV